MFLDSSILFQTLQGCHSYLKVNNYEISAKMARFWLVKHKNRIIGDLSRTPLYVSIESWKSIFFDQIIISIIKVCLLIDFPQLCIFAARNLDFISLDDNSTRRFQKKMFYDSIESWESVFQEFDSYLGPGFHIWG